MNIQKELLLFVATTIVSVGALTIKDNIVSGVILLLIGAIIFVGRGFYKKYVNEKNNIEEVVNEDIGK